MTSNALNSSLNMLNLYVGILQRVQVKSCSTMQNCSAERLLREAGKCEPGINLGLVYKGKPICIYHVYVARDGLRLDTIFVLTLQEEQLC